MSESPSQTAKRLGYDTAAEAEANNWQPGGTKPAVVAAEEKPKYEEGTPAAGWIRRDGMNRHIRRSRLALVRYLAADGRMHTGVSIFRQPHPVHGILQEVKTVNRFRRMSLRERRGWFNKKKGWVPKLPTRKEVEASG